MSRRCRRAVAGRVAGRLLLLLLLVPHASTYDFINLDDLESHISPEDLAALRGYAAPPAAEEPAGKGAADGAAGAGTASEGEWIGNRYWDDDYDDVSIENRFFNMEKPRVPKSVDCFGAGGGWLSRLGAAILDMRPATTRDINTHFYFTTRKQSDRVQVYAGAQFGLEWVDYDPGRRTVVIVHGFLSHSNASWVRNMTKAYLDYEDVNVITVDWSGGGNTWKYWRAVANTRQVGADLTVLLQQLIKATGCQMKDFHFVGHSLGAHICSYAASHLGGVRRITGLDPAQPCFSTQDRAVLLDASDADFVDVVHTNGRLLTRLGLGMPTPSGHADFYPNGGMKQPGCFKKHGILYKLWPFPISPTKLSQAICSHGRAYLLFTESLTSKNCTFRSHRWDMTLEGVNASLRGACDRVGSCSELGVRAEGVPGGPPRASGQYFVLTSAAQPFCPSEHERHHPSPLLLRDLAKGFQLSARRLSHADPPAPPERDAGYADPDLVASVDPSPAPPAACNQLTTEKPFWKFWKK